MTTAYLDSSAIVKLIAAEPESDALIRHLETVDNKITSALSRTEVIRAATKYRRVDEAREVIRGHLQLRIQDDVLDLAARLEPLALRSLDAIHLASALIFGDEIDELVTYDVRMAEAAGAHGFNVVAPA